jgi:chromosome segregation ATPase
MENLTQVKAQVAGLEKERQKLLQDLEKQKNILQKLTQDNANLKSNLRAGKDRLGKLFTEHAQAQKGLEDLKAQRSLLKAENEALREEKDKLAKDNTNLKAKIDSILRLGGVIGEFKRQISKVTQQLQKKADTMKADEGNRGYLIRDGQETSAAGKVKIEVVPAAQAPKEDPKGAPKEAPEEK